MYVTFQVANNVALDLKRGKPQQADSRKIVAALQDLGLRPEPLHPKSGDAELAKHFFVTVPSIEVANEVCARLRESSAVEAAYAKPQDAPPS